MTIKNMIIKDTKIKVTKIKDMKIKDMKIKVTKTKDIRIKDMKGLDNRKHLLLGDNLKSNLRK